VFLICQSVAFSPVLLRATAGENRTPFEPNRFSAGCITNTLSSRPKFLRTTGIEADIAVEHLDRDGEPLETIGVASQCFSNDELQETLLAFRLHKAWTGEYFV
jgi:hypothetical protein